MTRPPRPRMQVRGTGIQGHGAPHKTAADPHNVEAALARARRGGPPPLINVPERRTVIAALTGDGWTAGQIATALGLAQRNVVRHRAVLREDPTMPRHRPSGLYPADTAPDHNRPPLVVDQDGARFANLSPTKPTRLDQAHAALHLVKGGDRDVAECLGIADLYDLIDAARLELPTMKEKQTA